MTIDTSTSPSAAHLDGLAMRHVPLVAHLVRETMTRVPSSVDVHDLHAAGLVALLAATRDGDPRGSFAARATIAIRGALVDELRSVDWAARALRPRDPAAARARLDAVLCQLPDGVAAAGVLGLTATSDPRAAAAPARRLVDPQVRTDRRQCVTVALETLPQRLRQVAQGYFVDQRPMAELAAEIGASEARAIQLRDEGLVLLRDALATAMGPEETEPAPAHGFGAHARRRLAYTRAVAVQYDARRELAPAHVERLETTA